MRTLTGATALAQWDFELTEGACQIQVGEIWAATLGWRVFMLLEEDAIVFQPEEAEMLAEAYIARGGRALPYVAQLIDALLSCAVSAAEKNARRELPQDALARMTPMGNA